MGYVEKSPWSFLALVTGVFTCISLTSNHAWRRYAATHPNSVVTKVNKKGILYMEMWTYFNSIVMQGIVLPSLWGLHVWNAPSDWWFQGRRDWRAASFCGYIIAHYIQDSIFNRKENAPSILAHHIGTIALVVSAYASTGWRGLNLSMGLAYETGSIACCLVDLDLVTPLAGPLAMMGSSALGMAFVLHGFFCSPCPDRHASVVGVLAILGGLGRIHASHGFLGQIRRRIQLEKEGKLKRTYSLR